MAIVGRARIEQQKKIQLANIETRRVENLKKLDEKYESWDKAAKTIGYIAIAFLSFLFGSIFGNDLIKIFVHFFNVLKEWWKVKRAKQDNDELESEQVRSEIDQNYSTKLDEDLERVYFELVKANAVKRNTNNEPSV